MSTPTPDPTPDLVTAAYREVSSLAAALITVGLHGADAVSPPGWPEPWIFKWEPRRSVEGTGLASVVVTKGRTWAGANAHNTLRFPSIQIEVYADQARDTAEAPAFRDAQSRAEDVWAVIDPVLHRPDGGSLLWGDGDGLLRVVSSKRSSGEPDLAAVPETDGVWRLLMSYAVELG